MIRGYKAFDCNFKCRGHQFEVGKTYAHNGPLKMCKNGFHFCRYPADVLRFYFKKTDKYARVEIPEGAFVLDDADKSVTKMIKVVEEIPLQVLCEEMPGHIVRKDGSEEWYRDGKKHRDGDEPAEIWADGTKFWYKDGKQHRDGDEPAVMWADGSKYWYKDGIECRDGDEPAEIWSDGSKYWFKDGKLHRDGDEPAKIWADGSKSWYKYGKLHRDGDEPAEIGADGSKSWYKNGKKHRDGDEPAETKGPIYEN
jgi:hypothetical protein